MQPGQLDQRIKETLCQLIYDNGGFPVVDIGCDSISLREALSRCSKSYSINYRTFERNGMWFFGCTIASITVEGVNLTRQEYLEWVRKNKT